MSYYGVDGVGMHLPFNFHLIHTPWNAHKSRALISRYEARSPHGWPNWVLGTTTSIASPAASAAQARVAAMLL
jgi:alpha-glucosidase